MFNNIGDKLKRLSKVVGIGGAVIFLIVALINLGNPVLFATFLLVAALCIISAWPLYGFGQLIKSVTSIEEMIKNANN